MRNKVRIKAHNAGSNTRLPSRDKNFDVRVRMDHIRRCHLMYLIDVR